MGKDDDLEQDPFEIPGHPLHTLRQENLAIEAFLADGFFSRMQTLGQEDSPSLRENLLEDVARLMQIERHYGRIETLMLPILENHGHVAASRVLSSIQRDILRMLRALRDDLQRPDSDPQGIIDFTAFLVRDIQMLIRQEREVYTAPARNLVSEAQWREVAEKGAAFGYCLIETPPPWGRNTGD